MTNGSTLQVQPESGTLAPFVPRALLARLARPIEVLAETVDCTMVFADVSGFTRLSERLARRGREGAEQLVDVINACFTTLLAEAYGRGGSLREVRRRRDGAAVLRPGAQPGARAARVLRGGRRCARTAARGRPGPRRRRATSCCGCRSASTAATYAMFVVGGSHREFMIGGAGDDARSSRSRQPRPRARSWSARRPPDCCPAAAVGARDRPGLPARAGADRALRVGAAGRAASPTEAVVERFLPVAVRAHLRSGSTAPEHRTAAIAVPAFRRARRGDRCERALGRRAAGSTRSCALVQEAVERYDVCFLDSDIAADGVQDPVERRRPAGRRRRRGADAAGAAPHRRGRPAAAGPRRRQPRPGVHRRRSGRPTGAGTR